jgi:ABC-type nitrate/sulfonate/bicarbonate transport system permease component
MAPVIFGALRFGLGLAFKIMLIAEVLVTRDGIGNLAFEAYDTYRYQEAWVWAIVIAVLIIGLEIGLRLVERHVFEYRQGSGLSAAG